jgi:predicted component of type VI protein secretion system
MSGNSVIQGASQTIPFFNAWNQILSVTIKTLSGRGITPNERASNLAVLRNTTAKIAALSFIYAAIMGDDEEYDKKNREVRDRMIMIPGTGGMGVPLRSDIFLMPKLIGEYTYNLLSNDAFTDARMFKNAMAKSLKSSLMPPSDGIPQFIRPSLEVMMNYNLFQDREIVNATMRKFEPSEQYTNGTTETAKFLGNLINTSPLQIDHLVRGYTGSAGSLMLMFTDALIAKAQGIERPEQSYRELLSKVPNLGVAVGKENNTAVVGDFYELSREVNKVVDTYEAMLDTNEEKAEKYMSKPKREKLADVEGPTDSIGKRMAKLNKQEKDIRRSRELSGKEKAELIKEINDERNEWAPDVYEIRKEAGF